MGVKLLWTALAVSLVAPVISVPAGAVVAGVLAAIGCVLMWMDK
jgi:hypothetical protein